MQLNASATPDRAKLSTGRNTSRPIDLVHLSRYTLGDRSLEQEALELFCSQSMVYLDRLANADSDKAWADAAHSLKGSARAVGAWRVAEAAAAAEALSGEALMQDRKDTLDRLQRLLEETKSYVKSLLAER
ncbi:Hpt domain-containing protein [Methyloligella sp. 2.7D]|uniref:Hpt domain-containing protein n=1 Tax=unclassified Methyloligella TaxID=2625955 RepID=UPI00157C0996|nr:Hpt domain-containing protein [Methyloligella sp. GL2]QKP77878.1 Hpt domain-containing protein [Methyloligella sp. GL2]